MEGSNRSIATRAHILYNHYVLSSCVSSPGVPSLGRSPRSAPLRLVSLSRRVPLNLLGPIPGSLNRYPPSADPLRVEPLKRRSPLASVLPVSLPRVNHPRSSYLSLPRDGQPSSLRSIGLPCPYHPSYPWVSKPVELSSPALRFLRAPRVSFGSP